VARLQDVEATTSLKFSKFLQSDVIEVHYIIFLFQQYTYVTAFAYDKKSR